MQDVNDRIETTLTLHGRPLYFAASFPYARACTLSIVAGAVSDVSDRNWELYRSVAELRAWGADVAYWYDI